MSIPMISTSTIFAYYFNINLSILITSSESLKIFKWYKGWLFKSSTNMESLVQIESEEFNPESSNGCYESSDSQLWDSLLSGFEEFKESEGDISNAKNNLKVTISAFNSAMKYHFIFWIY